MPAATCVRPARIGRLSRMLLAVARPNPTSARLTAPGAQTGPVQGIGTRKRRSHVPTDEGQPMNAHSQR